MGAQPTADARFILVGMLWLAFILVLMYLRWRGHHGLLRTIGMPAALFVTFNYVTGAARGVERSQHPELVSTRPFANDVDTPSAGLPIGH